MGNATQSRRGRLVVAVAALCVLGAGITAVALAPAPPAQPDTATAAQATARQVMADFVGRRYADVWQLLTPAAQQAVPEQTWTSVYNGCTRAPLTYSVGATSMTAAAAEVVITVNTYPVRVDFEYTGGRWRYQPASLSMFAGGSVQADIRDARTFGICP